MTKFRPARGGLNMDEVVDVPAISDLERHLNALWGALGPITDVSVEPYAYDARIGWNTYLVTGMHNGGPRSVMGYTDGPL